MAAGNFLEVRGFQPHLFYIVLQCKSPVLVSGRAGNYTNNSYERGLGNKDSS